MQPKRTYNTIPWQYRGNTVETVTWGNRLPPKGGLLWIMQTPWSKIEIEWYYKLHTYNDRILITETKLGGKDIKMKTYWESWVLFTEMFIEGWCGIMIEIKKSYIHGEVKMYDNQESEIKFKDNSWIMQWIEIKLKYKRKLCRCSIDSLTVKQKSWNV